MTDYKHGEIVNVTFKNVQILTTDIADVYRIRYTTHAPVEEGNARETSFTTDSPNVAIERVAPPNWPPHVGDIWADADGERWFAQFDVSSDVDPPVMWMVPAHPHRFSQEFDGGARGYQAARWQAKRGPVALVYREDVAVSV